jgi:agmatinase
MTKHFNANSDFDPNAAASQGSGIFGLPFTITQAALVLLPIPWEVTTSYGKGTALGPQAILQASKQIDLFDLELGNFFTHGIVMLEESPEVQEWNKIAGDAASQVIAAGGGCIDTDPTLLNALTTVNNYSRQLNNYVYTQTRDLLAQGKKVGIVGGDHSTPFGAIQAFLEYYPQMGILHIDAHADAREAYEGFEHSHASIMYNVITQTTLPKLVQVGIRDFCEAEFDFINQHKNRIHTFYDLQMAEHKLNGQPWSVICDEIIQELPQQVYVSFDIDGLDPRYCPHTGTPVPGGLDFREVLYLFKKVANSGRKIIGFDLNEVSAGVLGPALSEDSSVITADPAAEWDANVAARLLYKLCGWTLKDS